MNHILPAVKARKRYAESVDDGADSKVWMGEEIPG